VQARAASDTCGSASIDTIAEWV